MCALFGAMSGQGPPVEWVSIHRYHHLHCDTPLDPHSPYEGFWWAHMGWIVNKKVSLFAPPRNPAPAFVARVDCDPRATSCQCTAVCSMSYTRSYTTP